LSKVTVEEAIAASFEGPSKGKRGEFYRQAYLRRAAWWIYRHAMGWSLGQVSKLYGNERHSVLDGVRRFEWELMHDADAVLRLNQALAALKLKERKAA
jgi:hypothetical protein